MAKFVTCVYCGSHLDFGEHCDCEKIIKNDELRELGLLRKDKKDGRINY